jgi:hypothetical protein
MDFETFIFVLILLTFIVLYISNSKNEVIYLKAETDNRVYLIRDLADKQKAVELLARINNDGLKLIKHLNTKYPDKRVVQRLSANYDENNISESSPDSTYTSYTIDKTQLVICLRSKEDNEFIDYNTLLYVFIHEMSHMATKKIGHVDVFWANFKFILQEAADMGLYKYEDYALEGNKKRYCGIYITSNILS